MRVEGCGRSWRSRRERVASFHLSSKIPHVCRARSVRGRSGCRYPLVGRRLGWASLLDWFRLLNHGLLQLLLRILLSVSLSSSSPLASSTQAPSTTLLLLVLELGGLVSCWFNCAEFIDLLLIRLGQHTCTSMGIPCCPHHEDDFGGSHLFLDLIRSSICK